MFRKHSEIRRRIAATLLLLVMSFTLFSCRQTEYETEDYGIDMPFHDGFRICQLTDLHFGIAMDAEREFSHLADIIEKADSPDLIVITGDTFIDATIAIVDAFFSFIDGYDIPFAFTYGNHDLQGDYDSYYIHQRLSRCRNALFIDYPNDALDGLANYYINLTKNGNTVYRLYIVDSQSYYNEGLFYEYDVIHGNQLSHIRRIAENEGDAVGLVFLHIPLTEYAEAYSGYQNGTYEGTGVNNEKICCGYENNAAYDLFRSVGVRAVFCGHDHINCSAVDYQNEIILKYGLKANSLVYSDASLIGFTEITLPAEEEKFGLSDIKDVFCPYE